MKLTYNWDQEETLHIRQGSHGSWDPEGGYVTLERESIHDGEGCSSITFHSPEVFKEFLEKVVRKAREAWGPGVAVESLENAINRLVLSELDDLARAIKEAPKAKVDEDEKGNDCCEKADEAPWGTAPFGPRIYANSQTPADQVFVINMANLYD